MKLVMTAYMFKNEALSEPLTGEFGVRGGSIGRAVTNALSLPDPDRHISRIHAQVRCTKGEFVLQNVGTTNPVVLNGQMILPGQTAPLSHADELLIGGYSLRVNLAISHKHTAIVPLAKESVPVTTDFYTAQTLAPQPWSTPTDPGPAIAVAPQKPTPEEVAAFAEFLNTPIKLTPDPPAPAAADEAPWYTLDEPVQQQPLAAHRYQTRETTTTMPVVRETRRSDPPVLARQPMPPIPSKPATPEPVVQPQEPAQPGTPDELWSAFCEGANISVKLPQPLNPALMRVLGQLLHESVAGILKLMTIRTAAKQELRSPVTTIQSRNNNPLKFSPDAQAAITQLLQPPARGFMVGPAAVTEAMDDLLGHACGTLSGMHAALTGVLQRFEPQRLEAKLSQHSLLSSLIPLHRQAKLWELYLEHYHQIQHAAEDDFHDLFGKAFLRVYDEQIQRLQQERQTKMP